MSIPKRKRFKKRPFLEYLLGPDGEIAPFILVDADRNLIRCFVCGQITSYAPPDYMVWVGHETRWGRWSHWSCLRANYTGCRQEIAMAILSDRSAPCSAYSKALGVLLRGR